MKILKIEGTHLSVSGGKIWKKCVWYKKGYKSLYSNCESEDATEKAIPLLVCNAVTVTISFGEISDYYNATCHLILFGSTDGGRYKSLKNKNKIKIIY